MLVPHRVGTAGVHWQQIDGRQATQGSLHTVCTAMQSTCAQGRAHTRHVFSSLKWKSISNGIRTEAADSRTEFESLRIE